MDTVDRWLARNGYWTMLVVAAFGIALSGDGEHRPLWGGFANLAYFVAAPLVSRGGVLGGAAFGYLRLPARVRRWSRWFRERIFRYRWPTAIAYGVLAGWFAQWHYDVAWFTVLHGTISGIAAAYAARPLPAQETAVAA